MKPKIHGKLELIPDVKLYREDLDEILSLFHHYCETVTISDADSEYESLDELKQHVGSRVRNIEIAGTKPNVTLTIMGSSMLRHLSEGLVLTPEETDKADLLFSRAKEFLLRRKRLLARLATIPAIVVVCLAITFVAFLIYRHDPTTQGGTIISVLLLMAPVAFISGATRSGAFRYVTLDSKTTASSFWKRNGDRIWMLLIGSGIGIFGTLLAQWLAHSLFK
jgi:hypothetical protein